LHKKIPCKTYIGNCIDGKLLNGKVLSGKMAVVEKEAVGKARGSNPIKTKSRGLSPGLY
jgi:hypothetical protein